MLSACSWGMGTTLLALVTVTGGCRARVLQEHAQKAPAAATPAPAPSVKAPEAVDVATTPPPEVESIDIGVWAKTDVYDVRLEAQSPCVPASAAKTRYLGLKIKVRSKTKSLFVAPRDATLQDGGYLFPALPDPKVPGCKPLLRPTYVRNQSEVTGFVVFELPERTGKLTLAFSPTRWGGASTVRVAVPEAGKAAPDKEQRRSRAKTLARGL